MGIRISGGRVRGVCEYCGECVYEADLSEDEIDIATDRLNAHECAEQDPDWLADDAPDPDPYSDSKTGVELVRVVRDSGLVKNEAMAILAQFQDSVSIISEWEKRAADITVTDETQTAEMALAKSARKEVAKARTGAKKLHDELKADSLRRGQFIDGIFRVIAAHAKPVEEYLEKQEKFVEIREAERLLERQREIERRMAEEDRIAREKEEADQKAREIEAAAERERLRVENERLRNEAAEREAAVREERREREAAEKKIRDDAAAKQKEIEDAAAVERAEAERRDRDATAALEAEKKAREEAEAKLAAMVTCPACGHQWEP